MSASSEPSYGAVEPDARGGHWTVTLMAVVPTLAAVKLTLKIFKRGLGDAMFAGDPLSSKTVLEGVTPLTVPRASTEADNWSRGEE
jgi:hypothetical protein